jgi:hypothetical protein
MHKLSSEEQLMVKDVDRMFGKYLKTIMAAQQFKLDDFLILKISRYGRNMEVATNSYGAPVKYRVVYVDEHSIPYVKRINKKGEPYGSSFSSCIGIESDEYFSPDANFIFELDPDYTDSILLQDDYDPASLHRSKKEIWKAVTEHNKANKIKTTDLNDLVKFMSTVSVGDTLWTSNVSYYLVQDAIKTTGTDFNSSVKRGTARTRKTKLFGSPITMLTLKDKNGKISEVTPDFFHWRALYKARPRTYKELNI